MAGAQAAGVWMGVRGVWGRWSQKGGWRDWLLIQEVWDPEPRSLFLTSTHRPPCRLSMVYPLVTTGCSRHLVLELLLRG